MFNKYLVLYLKFLVRSSNAHGVHSPFVYDLVTKCFYNKKKECLSIILAPIEFKKKHLETLNEVFRYFNVQKALYFISENHFLEYLPNAQIIQKFEVENNTDLDLVYLDPKNQTVKKIQDAFHSLRNQGMLIIEQPYKNIEMWQKVKSNPKAQVIVDTYFFGFIFLRKTQAKEAFCIRL